MSQITEYEQKLNTSLVENKKILAQLHEKNESLSECNVLLSRYSELTTQYTSDLKRLSFIVDGEANLKEVFPSHCPFCDGKIVVNKSKNYIDAAKADYKKIKLQAKDLKNAFQELLSERLTLEHEVNVLMSKKKSTEDLIENEIKPQLSILRDKFSSYKELIEYQKEIDILKKISEQKEADIVATESDAENEVRFKVKDHLDYGFVCELAKGVKLFLEECKFENLLTVVFDKTDMDIVINGKKKAQTEKDIMHISILL